MMPTRALLLAIAALAMIPHRGHAAPPVSDAASRHALGLEGAPNFRDLGGYRTADGRTVRGGEVFRSNKLSALTPSDIALIKTLHIVSLIDFRAGDERQAEPDRWAPGFVYQSPKPSIGPVMRLVMEHPKTGQGFGDGMRDLYAQMPHDYAPEFGAMLHRLAASDAPLLMHCTAGKDRTGLGSAILLALLGIPHATIVQDYSLTQDLLPQSPKSVSAKSAAAVKALPADAQQALLAADPSYLEAAFRTIDRDYGSVEKYATDGLGVSRTEIEAIRARLLTSAPR